ncbi:hypothetical protein BJ741DRAFT_538311 [Chytriomyces cf. hyalinus JEL632]|nr:hypothetical protein BJ741DRAFT_538311 [Chytriomyces cf. hyalinus JEL632]
MDSYTVVNASVFSVCVLLVLSYHLWLASVVRRNPEKTVYGVNSHGRKAWVAAIMRGKKDILAVQSLRNLIMAASILASTCVIIMLGIIAFLATVISRPESVDSDKNPLGSQFGFFLDHLFGAKVMGLLVVFCASFFCFAQSMRFYNHVGMVININISAEELEESMHLSPHHSTNVDFVARLLNRGSMYYTFGMRGYYFSFPIMAYLWGPWSLLVATVLLMFTLRVVDFNADVVSPGYGGAGMKRRSDDLEEQGATANDLSGLGITSNRRREGAKDWSVAV